MREYSDTEHVIKYYFDKMKKGDQEEAQTPTQNAELAKEKDEDLQESEISDFIDESMSTENEDVKVNDAKLPILKEIMLCLESSGSKIISKDILTNAMCLVRKHHDLPNSLDKIILESFEEASQDQELHRLEIRTQLESLIP